MLVSVDGKEVKVRGRVNFFYPGQPYICRECNVQHTTKCPQVIARIEAEKQGEKARQLKANTLLIGDSNIRLINEQAFFAKTDCATGAKIGHIANTLKHVNPADNNNLVVHAGQNNVDRGKQTDMVKWNNQLNYEVGALKKGINKLKKTVLVGVPPAPCCMETDKTTEMRSIINNSLKKLANDNPNVSFVNIEQGEERKIEKSIGTTTDT